MQSIQHAWHPVFHAVEVQPRESKKYLDPWAWHGTVTVVMVMVYAYILMNARGRLPHPGKWKITPGATEP